MGFLLVTGSADQLMVDVQMQKPDSRNPYGWYPLKMHQITRASPAELRTIVRAITETRPLKNVAREKWGTH